MNFDDYRRITIQELQAMGLFLENGDMRNPMLEDDVDDYSDNSHHCISESEISQNSISQILRKRQAGMTGQWHTTISQKLIPKVYAQTSASFSTRVYNGQFSQDGSLFFSSCQDEIKIYDTSDPYNWKLLQECDGLMIQWTISDIDISPCNKYLIYSTMDSHVNLLSIGEDDTNKFNLFNPQVSFELNSSQRNFAVYSVKFSGLGTEVLAGTSMDSIEVYDLIKRKNVFSVKNAHDDDINTVCWANRDESQVVFTGSDDSSIKIWDRRSMKKCQGVLVGHREGISHISSRGDGIHLISNGKDQCCKLWDIRYYKTFDEYRHFRDTHEYQTGFDYRWDQYTLQGYKKRLAADSSIMTFRGHSVLGTLIRCYFSPLFSTAQRYVYSGSADGQVYVYDTVTGKTVTKLKPEVYMQTRGRGMPTARDVSWHPFLPIITATSFLGNINYYYYDDDGSK